MLVLLAQRLALRTELYTVQTLTALHDKANAWLGLGSAAVSMWQQTKVCAALSGVTCIAVYLTAIFALHITIPAIFNVAPFNATMLTMHQTKLATASFNPKYVYFFRFRLRRSYLTLGTCSQCIISVGHSIILRPVLYSRVAGQHGIRYHPNRASRCWHCSCQRLGLQYPLQWTSKRVIHRPRSDLSGGRSFGRHILPGAIQQLGGK